MSLVAGRSMFWWLVMALALLGCAEDAAVSPLIAVIALENPIAFGQGFGLEVRRRFPRDAAAEPFDPSGLGPFVLVPEGVLRTAIPGGIDEVYRFRAHAFLPGSLVIPPQRLVVRRGQSAERIEVLSAPIAINVTSGLSEGDPLSLELPAARAEWPESQILWTALSSGVALLALVAFLRLAWPKRRPPAAAAERTEDAPVREDPWADFERRLQDLRVAAPAMEASALHEALYAAWIAAMQATSASAAERTAVEWQAILRERGGATQSSIALLAGEDRWRFAPLAADDLSKAEALRLAEGSLEERRAHEGASL